jgi:phage shock protein PspC (stress-responsive transcriptional regulator)
MSNFSVSQKQLNDIAKGKPVQMSYASLSSSSPNMSIQGLGMPTLSKIRRAIKEQRGARLKLTPEQIASIKTTLKGGNFLDDLKKTFDPKQNGVAAAFAPDGAAERFGKSLARPAIKGVSNVALGALLTAAGNPEVAPFVAPFASMAIDKALDKANLGFGVKKGSAEAKAKMAKIRAMRKSKGGELGGVSEGYGIAEDVVKLFTKGKGVLGGKKGMRGCGTPILDQQFSINEARDALGKMFGFGVPPKMVKELKSQMTDLFSGHMTAPKAKSLAAKVFKHGVDILNLPSIKIAGGAFGLSSLTDAIKSGARQLFELAKPAIKLAGQTGISYVKPLATEALKGIASSYGIDPTLANLAANIASETAGSAANAGLSQITTKSPKAPQQPKMTINKLEGSAQHSAEPKAAPKGKTSRSTVRTSKGGSILDEQFSINQARDTLRDMFGGELRTDMGHLLNINHPSMTPFSQPSNLPQGKISGGSFRGYGSGTPILDQRFSVNEAKQFLTKDIKKLFGGAMRSNQSSEGGSFM